MTYTIAPSYIAGTKGQAINGYVGEKTYDGLKNYSNTSISVWILKGKAFRITLTRGSSIIPSWALETESDSLRLLNVNDPFEGTTIKLNSGWNHICLILVAQSYNNTTSTHLYINGSLTEKRDIAPECWFNPVHVNGCADELKLYNRILSDNEVSDLYNPQTPIHSTQPYQFHDIAELKVKTRSDLLGRLWKEKNGLHHATIRISKTSNQRELKVR